MRLQSLLGLCVLLGAALLAAPLRAQELEIRSSFAPVQSDTVVAAISVEEATRLVRKQTGGRVLNAEPSFLRGQAGVKVRVLVDGARVVTLFVDDEGRIRGR